MYIHPNVRLILLVLLLFLLAACLSVPVPPEMVQPVKITAAPLTATPTQDQSPSPAPSQTASPSPSPTPIPTPTLVLPVTLGAALPELSEPITAANLDRIVEVARYGRGRVLDLAYSPDGRFLAVATTLGLDVLDSTTLEDVCRFSAPSSGEPGSNIFAAFRSASEVVTATPDGIARIVTLPGCLLMAELDIAFSADLRNTHGPNIAFQSLAEDGSYAYFRAFNTSGSGPNPTAALYRADLAAGGTVERLALLDGVLDASQMYLSTDQSIFVINQGYTAAAWAIEDGGARRLLLSKAAVFGLSPDGTRLASFQFYVRSGATDTTIIDPRNNTLLGNLDAPENVFAFRFSPDNTSLAIIMWDGIDLVDSRTGSYLGSIDTGSAPADALRFSPDGMLAALGTPGGLALWDLENGLRIARRPEYANLVDPTFSQGTGRVAAGSFGSVYVFETRTGEMIGPLENQHIAAISADGSLLAAADRDNALSTWSLPGLEEAARIETNSSHLAAHPAEARFISGAFAQNVREYSFSDLQQSGAYSGMARTDGLAFSPDGRWLVGWDIEGLHVFDSVSRRQVYMIPATAQWGSGLTQGMPAFTGEDTLAWLSYRGSGVSARSVIFVYSISSQKMISEIQAPTGGTALLPLLTFSQAGGLLAASARLQGALPGTRDFIIVWDWASRQVLAELPLPAALTGMLFSPDGTLLITTTGDGVLRLLAIDPRGE